jgi:hypothetical protein
VKLRGHWVCPGTGDPLVDTSSVCAETDFILETTINGTLRINPENLGVDPENPGTRWVPTPDCDEGFLIVWVVGKVDLEGIELEEGPIKFDALIGDAILRFDGGSAAAYNAYPIQARDSDAVGTPYNADGDLRFDNSEYKQLPERFYGTVRYEESNSITVSTHLTLLTLAVHSNRPNGVTFVDLDFFDEDENPISESTQFFCWQQIKLSDINASLNTSFGTKGLVASRDARQACVAENDCSEQGELNDVPILAIITTTEALEWDPDPRAYAYSTYSDDYDTEIDTFHYADEGARGLSILGVEAPLPVPEETLSVTDVPLLPGVPLEILSVGGEVLL